MKKSLFLWAVFAVMMAFTACTKEKVVYVEKENVTELKPGEGVIKISLSNNISRSPRPITSNEATNNVNRIAFVFVKSNNNQYTPVIADGEDYTHQGNVLAISDNTIAANEEIEVHFENMTEGSYKIIAYGYHCASDGNYDFPYEIEEANGYDGYIKMRPESGSSITPVEEIFAGIEPASTSTYLKVNSYGNFVDSNIKITLERQVAGLLAYLSNIPEKVLSGGVDNIVEKITISTPFEATGLYIPGNTGNGKSDYNGVGTWKTNEYIDLLTFDLSQATVSDGYYTFTGGTGKKFLLAEENESQTFTDLKCQDNTLFGSCFVIPFVQHYANYDGFGKGTLHINYYDNSGSLIVSKPLRIKSESVATDADYEFDIKRNHFYSIGTKDADYDGSGNPDEDTEDDPLPVDLESGSDNLKVTISEKWFDTHNLTNK